MGKNGKIRTITRRSFGFHDVSALIAMIFMCCSGIRIPLPGKLPRQLRKRTETQKAASPT